MLRVKVLSDLHIEHDGGFKTNNDDSFDVVILAGDTNNGVRGLEWASKTFSGKQIIYILGNHELYTTFSLTKKKGEKPFDATKRLFREKANDLGITLLDNDALIIDGVRFLGATLWTDFRVNEHRGQTQELAMSYARGGMNDYIVCKENGVTLTPEITLGWHNESLAWLIAQLQLKDESFRKTVVITHHLPTRNSIGWKYEGDGLNTAFASNLEHLFRYDIDTWIHGHTHDSYDYPMNKTRVLCNPKGYKNQNGIMFQPELIIEL